MIATRTAKAATAITNNISGLISGNAPSSGVSSATQRPGRTARGYSPACKAAGSAQLVLETISWSVGDGLRVDITQTSCFLPSCNPQIPNQFFRPLD
jgi:hypothetical protein